MEESKHTFANKLLSFTCKHLTEVLSILFGQTFSFVNGRTLGLLPIPGDLRAKGICIYTPINSILMVMIVAFSVRAVERSSSTRRRCTTLGIAAVAIAFMIAACWLFYRVEAAWKTAESPDFLYYVIEPFVYGLAFSSLAAFLAAASAFGMDIITNRSTDGLAVLPTDMRRGFQVVAPEDSRPDATKPGSVAPTGDDADEEPID